MHKQIVTRDEGQMARAFARSFERAELYTVVSWLMGTAITDHIRAATPSEAVLAVRIAREADSVDVWDSRGVLVYQRGSGRVA